MVDRKETKEDKEEKEEPKEEVKEDEKISVQEIVITDEMEFFKLINGKLNHLINLLENPK